MTVGFYLLRFVRLIADLIGGHRSRLDPVSFELKFINGNGNTPCANAEKAAHINGFCRPQRSSRCALITLAQSLCGWIGLRRASARPSPA